MSHWDTPDTVSKAEALRDIMSRPLKARFAGSSLAGVAGSDVLFDRIDDVGVSSPYSDVRAIVSNWLEQIVFSWRPALKVVDEAAVVTLDGIASGRYGLDPSLQTLCRFGENDFLQALSDVGLRHRTDVGWRIAPDDGRYDLFSVSDDGEMYRFSKIDGGLIDIHPDNMARYAARFENALEATP